jgi:hypothetical protein
MATDADFEQIDGDGKTHRFKRKDGTGEVSGTVDGQGKVVAVTDKGASKTWNVKEATGNSQEIAASEYDIDPPP